MLLLLLPVLIDPLVRLSRGGVNDTRGLAAAAAGFGL